MPAKPPKSPPHIAEMLVSLGEQIRAQRKSLGINATVAAEAAGISRITLYRIEKGESSVTLGAYWSTIAALGCRLTMVSEHPKATPEPISTFGWIPAQIRLADYPQLKQLAWQVQGVDELRPLEAWGIYERNWRHVDEPSLLPQERRLVDALRAAFEGVTRDV